MKAKPLTKLICLAGLLLGGQTMEILSQDNQGSPTMEFAQIQSTAEANNAAVSAGDIEGAVATFEPDAAMAVQPGKAVSGAPALREAFKQFLAINPKISVTGQEVIQAGDIALHSFTWRMTGKAPDGSPIERDGL